MLAFTLAACGGGDAGGGGDATNGYDETFHITAAHSHAEALSVHTFFGYFKEEIERLSGGRITMDVFGGGVLGGDRDLTEGVQTGEITMMGANINPHAMFMPDLAIFDVQFIHPDLDSGRATRNDSELLAQVRSIYEADGFHFLGFTDSGFRYLTANFPIMTPAELRGLTIRSSANNFHVANWEALGANPTPLPIGEVYIALQQGTVDAQDNPIEHNLLFNFWEQQTHFMETNNLFHVNTYVMSPAFYNSLPADLQTAVDQAAATALQKTQASHDGKMQDQIDFLEDNGITFVHYTPAQLEAFAALSRTTWPLIEDAVSAQTWDVFMAAVERAQQ